MSDLSVARRYATALYELAVEQGAESKVVEELGTFVAAVRGTELGVVLTRPLFDAGERAAVLNAVLPRLGVGTVVGNFVRVVSDRNRCDALAEIHRELSGLIDARAGVVRVEVRTVEPLTPELEAQVRAAFGAATGKTVVLDARRDPSLLGGLVARMGDHVYDASLATRLAELQRSLLDSPVSASAEA